MDKIKAIQVVERHRQASRDLGLEEDFYILNEVLELIKSEKNEVCTLEQKKNKNGAAEFQRIITNEAADLSEYDIDGRILANKDGLLDFWCSLDENEKNSFTIFELNVLLYLISKQYNKYQKKDKKKILSFINTVTKDLKLDSAYKNIVV